MEYLSMYSEKSGWSLGKLIGHQAIRLSEEELGEIVNALNANEKFIQKFLEDVRNS